MQVNPHQMEGFNFLISNLVVENPRGGILVHAPGSWKTFMIISFMQSFLVMSSQARSLVVLPKGISAVKILCEWSNALALSFVYYI